MSILVHLSHISQTKYRSVCNDVYKQKKIFKLSQIETKQLTTYPFLNILFTTHFVKQK